MSNYYTESMKTLLSILLFLWIAGSSYWYVCKIRCDCKLAAVEIPASAGLLAASKPDTLAAAVSPAVEPAPEKLILHYPNGSIQCNLTANEKEQLVRFREFIEKNPGRKVIVSGFTDISGESAINQKISRGRAESAMKTLVETGVPASAIETAYFGADNPVAANTTEEGRQQNRRTEIEIH